MRFLWYTLLILFFLSVSSSCELLLPPEEPPVILLGVRFERVYPEERHRVELRIRVREEPVPEAASLRLVVESSVPIREDEEGVDDTLLAELRATRSVEPLGPRTGHLEITFDSPFTFLPREPMVLSALTLLSVETDYEQIWAGELTYPYSLEEQLNEPE